MWLPITDCVLSLEWRLDLSHRATRGRSELICKNGIHMEAHHTDSLQSRKWSRGPQWWHCILPSHGIKSSKKWKSTFKKFAKYMKWVIFEIKRNRNIENHPKGNQALSEIISNLCPSRERQIIWPLGQKRLLMASQKYRCQYGGTYW